MGVHLWGLPPSLLDQVSPFHLVLDTDLVILQAGSSLRRLCPQILESQRLGSAVEVVSPAGDLSWEFVTSRPRSLFVLKVRAGELTLRGQMLHDEAAGVLIFVGSPWVTELADIAERGLTLDDFGVSDSIVDHLLLLQTQGTALQQARTLADSLQRSTLDLKIHARRLERLTRELESVLNSAADGIYGLDNLGTVTFLNDTAGRLLGLSSEQLVGRKLEEVICSEAASTTGAEAQRSSGCTGQVMSVVGRHRRADGSWFDSELVSAPILEDGSLVGSVVVFRDISERRKLERVKDEFISVVSHELRTPLTSIRGALGLLNSGATGELPPTAGRLVEVATISSDRLIRLINDILQLEGLAVGKLDLRPRALSARRLVHDGVAEMAGLAAASGVRIRSGGVEGTVLADRDRIVQTLSNLLGNAVKFSEAGATVEVETSVEADVVRFDIRDTGRGIPADQLETVFEPFRQIDSSDTREKGGTGLGLAVCRGLVERHGGRIWATSAPGGGTTMSFTLPRAMAEAAS